MQTVEAYFANYTLQSFPVLLAISTIQRAERIIVLHHGEIREQGSHQELLSLRGLYWRLYKLQYADGSGDEARTDEPFSPRLQYGD